MNVDRPFVRPVHSYSPLESLRVEIIGEPSNLMRPVSES